jgi:hypothetical protein
MGVPRRDLLPIVRRYVNRFRRAQRTLLPPPAAPGTELPEGWKTARGRKVRSARALPPIVCRRSALTFGPNPPSLCRPLQATM